MMIIIVRRCLLDSPVEVAQKKCDCAFHSGKVVVIEDDDPAPPHQAPQVEQVDEHAVEAVVAVDESEVDRAVRRITASKQGLADVERGDTIRESYLDRLSRSFSKNSPRKRFAFPVADRDGSNILCRPVSFGHYRTLPEQAVDDGANAARGGGIRLHLQRSSSPRHGAQPMVPVVNGRGSRSDSRARFVSIRLRAASCEETQLG
jgi:hypothetical protein